MIPVDPAQRDDPNYQCRMPPIEAKREGVGSGVRTVLPNFREVCDSLHRPEEILLKCIGRVLGTHAMYMKRSDKFLVPGVFPQEVLQDNVDGFIVKYVLCSTCRSPETDPIVVGAEAMLACRSCGKQTIITAADRAQGLFLAYYSPKKQTLKAAAKKDPTPVAPESKVEDAVEEK